MSILYVRDKDGTFTRIKTVNGGGVKTVNGVEPDADGNVVVATSAVSSEHLILKDKVTEAYNKIYVADGKLTMAKE